jgi:hypothetical protein
MAASALRRILGALFRRGEQVGTSLVVTPTGLTIAPLRHEPSSLFVLWSEVEKVTVFKRDRMTVDEIWTCPRFGGVPLDVENREVIFRLLSCAQYHGAVSVTPRAAAAC